MNSMARLLVLAQLWAMPSFVSSEGLLRGSGGVGRDLTPEVVNRNNGTAIRHLARDNIHHQADHISWMEPRIIGGGKAKAGRYSYMVALIDEFSLFCGGVLISSDFVMTAAHCAENEYVEMFVGSTKLSDRNKGKGELVYPSKKFIHPKYNWVTMENDYALYKLERPQTNVEVIRVNDDNGTPSSSGKRLTALGWGDTDPASGPFNYEGSDDLMRVDVGYIPNNVCSQREGYVGLDFVGYGGQVKNNMMCALGKGKDGCQGDSGGPLIEEGNDGQGRQDTLVGLSSWGVACAHSTLPGVYARVSSEYSWIRSVVCKYSDAPAPSFRCDGCGSRSGSDCDISGGSNNKPEKPAKKPRPNQKPSKQNSKPKPNNKPNKKPKPNKPNKKPGKKPSAGKFAGKKPNKKPGKKPNKKPGKKPGKKPNGKKPKPKRPAKQPSGSIFGRTQEDRQMVQQRHGLFP